MNKITKREMYEAIIVMVAGGEMKYDKDTFIDFCQNEIDLLDKKAAKAKDLIAQLTQSLEAMKSL